MGSSTPLRSRSRAPTDGSHSCSQLLLWLALAAAAALVGLLSETSALQLRSPSQVVRPIFVIQMIVPVLLAPNLAGEHWTTSPAGEPPLALAFVSAGVFTLARRPAIARGLARSSAGPSRASPDAPSTERDEREAAEAGSTRRCAR